MKKVFYTLALGAILLAGCSQDESPISGQGKAVKMTFTADLSNGIQSRGEGEAVVSVDKLICAVCKQSIEGDNAYLSEVLIRDTVDVDVTTGKAVFTPTLLKGYKYGIVFWAYKDGTNFYDTNDLTKITFTPNASDNVNPNAEGLVTYTRTIKDVSTASSGDDLKVTLTRPLAQVNIATTKSDWNVVEQLGETPNSSTVILKGCSNEYNALNGNYSGDKDFTYTISLNKENMLSNTDNILLGTGYTFPGSNVTCSISVLKGTETKEEIYKAEIPNLPTTANYRTNIVPATNTSEEETIQGGLITGSVSYEVTISEGYTESINKSQEELEEENKNEENEV